jgi:hypothetical protein
MDPALYELFCEIEARCWRSVEDEARLAWSRSWPPGMSLVCVARRPA